MLPLNFFIYSFIFIFLFIHKMHIYLYIYSLDILLTCTFTAHQDLEARSYARIFCRALSDYSTDKDHLSKVVIYWRLSLSKRTTLNCPNITVRLTTYFYFFVIPISSSMQWKTYFRFLLLLEIQGTSACCCG